MAAKIRKGDKVIVITGRDKGVQGEVIRMIPTEDRAVVRGVNVRKKHKKPTAMAEGSVRQEEAPIHVSNLALVDPQTGGPTRVGFKVKEDGRKVRIAKKSGVEIDG
jgi:large subunit ribosomal protein L24